MNANETPIVVLGRGKDGKNRAAVFGYQDAEAAKRAVALMGLKIGRAETPEAVTLAKRLPQGKVFASGKGLLPLVKRDLLDKLLKVIDLVEVPVPTAADASTNDKVAHDKEEKGPSDPKPTPAFTNPWDLIAAGSTILYSADPKEGWFPCKVVGVSADGKKLTLKWRDFPKFPEFEVKRIAVGLVAKIH